MKTLLIVVGVLAILPAFLILSFIIGYRRMANWDSQLEGIRERNTRWPFFVNDPVEIWLASANQYWLFKFSPGKFYEERRMDYGTANVKPGAQSHTPEAK